MPGTSWGSVTRTGITSWPRTPETPPRSRWIDRQTGCSPRVGALTHSGGKTCFKDAEILLLVCSSLSFGVNGPPLAYYRVIYFSSSLECQTVSPLAEFVHVHATLLFLLGCLESHAQISTIYPTALLLICGSPGIQNATQSN